MERARARASTRARAPGRRCRCTGHREPAWIGRLARGASSRRSSAAAEGNPLYVEQMLSMLVDSGVVRQEEGKWVAREDRRRDRHPADYSGAARGAAGQARARRAGRRRAGLGDRPRVRAAGRAIVAARAVRDGIDEKLQALSRKHFIRPSVGTEGDPRYRFDHHLVRDTVYNGLLKRARATMHARVRQVGGPGQRGQRSRSGVRGDPGLPPGTGVQVPGRARADRRRGAALGATGRSPGLGGAPRLRAWRHARIRKSLRRAVALFAVERSVTHSAFVGTGRSPDRTGQFR